MYSRAYQTGVGIGLFVYGIAYIIIAIILGFVTKKMNENKGYTGGFAWGFWLGIIGVIVVACKTPINNQYSDAPRYAAQDSGYYHQPGQPSYNTWKCVCGQDNSEKLSYCTRCRRTKDEVLAELSKVACPNCGAMNKKSNQTCFACGRPMYETGNLYSGAIKEAVRSLEKDAEQVNENTEKATGPKADAIDLLKQLAKLHDQGILTDQEFESKKADILAKI